MDAEKKKSIYIGNIKFHKDMVASLGREKFFLYNELDKIEELKLTTGIKEYSRRSDDIKQRLTDIDKSMQKSFKAIIRGCNGIEAIK